ncbi:hypothetical protein [Pseudoalteromonas xiamenensis]
MSKAIPNNLALQCIASFLNAKGCKTFDDVVEATQELIDTAKLTQNEYRNGIAEKSSRAHTVN